MKTLPHRNLIKEQLLDKDGDFDLDRFLRAYNDQQATVSTILGGGFRLSANGGAAIISARLRVPEYPWTAVESFGTNYSNKGGDYPACQYLLWPGGRVYVRGGLVKSGAQSALETMCTLPAEARPDKAYDFAGLAGTAYGPYAFEVGLSGAILNVDSTKNGTLATIQCDFQGSTSVGAPKPFNWTDDGWKVKHGLGRCTGLVPLYAEVVGDSRNETVGQFTLEWKDRGDGTLAIRSAYGLQPGKTYNLRLLALSE